MTKTTYRALLLLSLVIGVMGGGLDLVRPSLLPEAMRLAQDEYDASLSMLHLMASLVVAMLGLLLMVASIVGLYQFRRWAPKLALVSTALCLLAVPLFGAMAQSGYSIALLEVASHLWGAALVLSFVAPYREWFVETQTTQ